MVGMIGKTANLATSAVLGFTLMDYSNISEAHERGRSHD